MNLDKLKQITSKLSEEQAKAGSNHNGEWPLVCFPPDGIFRGRFITDPSGELYEKFFHYGYFAKGIRDPETVPKDQLPADFRNELQEVSKKLVENKKFSRGRKTAFLVYFYITAVDNPTEDFKVGNLVCLVGDGRFANAFNDVLQSLMKDASDKLLNSLSPDKKGPIMEVNIVRGAQGKCTISPTFSELDPLVNLTPEQQNLPEAERQKLIAEALGPRGYKPLAISYIKPGFDADKYATLLTSFKEELAEIEAKKAAKSEGTQPTQTQSNETTGTQEQVQTTQTAETVQVINKPEETSVVATDSNPQEVQPSVVETKTDNPFAKFKRQD